MVDPAVGRPLPRRREPRLGLTTRLRDVEVAEAQQIRFTDPTSGYTYVARLYGNDAIDGKVVDKGIASRMLAHANDLLVASFEVVKDADGHVIVDDFGQPVLALDDEGFPILLPEGRIAELNRYVGLLDATRQIGYRLGYGPIGGVSD